MSYHHLALTGPPGIGKTTYIRKLTDAIIRKGIPCCGFVTVEVRDKGRRIGFDVETIDGTRGVLARTNLDFNVVGKSKVQNTVGQYVVDVDSFEAVALPIFSTSQIANDGIIILDEIGKMEMFSSSFVKRVRELVNNPKNIMIVTIPVPKGRPIPLVEEIRNHTNFKVQSISRANRDDENLFKELLNYCTSGL